jgi:hypothetical protein
LRRRARSNTPGGAISDCWAVSAQRAWGRRRVTDQAAGERRAARALQLPRQLEAGREVGRLEAIALVVHRLGQLREQRPHGWIHFPPGAGSLQLVALPSGSCTVSVAQPRGGAQSHALGSTGAASLQLPLLQKPAPSGVWGLGVSQHMWCGAGGVESHTESRRSRFWSALIRSRKEAGRAAKAADSSSRAARASSLPGSFLGTGASRLEVALPPALAAHTSVLRLAVYIRDVCAAECGRSVVRHTRVVRLAHSRGADLQGVPAILATTREDITKWFVLGATEPHTERLNAHSRC